MHDWVTGVSCQQGLWMNSLTLFTMAIGSGSVLRWYPLSPCRYAIVTACQFLATHKKWFSPIYYASLLYYTRQVPESNWTSVTTPKFSTMAPGSTSPLTGRLPRMHQSSAVSSGCTWRWLDLRTGSVICRFRSRSRVTATRQVWWNALTSVGTIQEPCASSALKSHPPSQVCHKKLVPPSRTDFFVDMSGQISSRRWQLSTKQWSNKCSDVPLNSKLRIMRRIIGTGWVNSGGLSVKLPAALAWQCAFHKQSSLFEGLFKKIFFNFIYPFFFKIVHYVDKTESFLTCHILSKLLFCPQFCQQSACRW